jgi:hypothetical protein
MQLLLLKRVSYILQHVEDAKCWIAPDLTGKLDGFSSMGS